MPISAASSPQSIDDNRAAAPQLPKGGGAIRAVDEKLGVNPSSGAANASFPLPISPLARGGAPELAIGYDTGGGNGPFGVGWRVDMPAITRRTDRGLPRYRDAAESDLYVLSGAEELVPLLVKEGDEWVRHRDSASEGGASFTIERYRPRIEGLFARIERWTNQSTGDIHWRSISRDATRSIFGRDVRARIFDPADPRRVFEWLLEHTEDVRGNIVQYVYKPEDSSGIDANASEERGRLAAASFAQRYIKRIAYGNRMPGVADGFLFEIVFDYGEHSPDDPKAEETPGLTWHCRKDVFSTFRPGFDSRTYRLCRRVLMFHHIAEEGIDDVVRAMTFDYDEDAIVTRLRSITESGFTRQGGSLVVRSWPPVEMGYSEPAFDETVRDLDRGALEGLFPSPGESHPRWIDLDGEGVSGMLWSEPDRWLYRRNLGGGHLAPPRVVRSRPALASMSTASGQLVDVDGDGLVDMVAWGDANPGFYGRDLDAAWLPFKAFKVCPNVAWDNPNLRFVDVVGDGLSDVLISEDDRFRFYPSLGVEGFGPSETAPRAKDETKGPALLFSDREQTVFLADMTGDGLSDIVRVRNGEISYWPNLGYGRFGARVVMGSAPRFDDGESFDPRRVRLADIDGSGAADILYIGRTGVSIHINESGNRLSPPRLLESFPGTNDLDSVSVFDLLGSGTACLVWSSPLLHDEGRQVRYVDLLGGTKPHLLVELRNNLGRQTNISYTTSTKLYLQDRAAGHRWATRLPFPVHVVESVEHRDLVLGRRILSTYRHRHGYYDGVERELRGFGLVERIDAETLADGPADLALAPVLTRTWIHTGVYVGGGSVARHMAKEYYQSDAHPQAALLDDTILPAHLDGAELREACRALKGQVLREEVYALDGDARAAHPYRVSERSYRLRPLQPKGEQRHAVFITHLREAVELHYERDPNDPRVSHELTLEVDKFGNVVRSAAIAYPRRPDPAGAARPPQQSVAWMTSTEATMTTVIDDATNYRAPMSAEMRAFELTGLDAAPGDARLTFEAVDAAARGAVEILYEATPTAGFQKRCVKDMRTLYYKDDRTGALPFKQMGVLGLVYQTYQAALTAGTLAVYGSRVDSTTLTEGGYVVGSSITVSSDWRDGTWWIPSARSIYETTLPTFLSPLAVEDPFGHSTSIVYTSFELFAKTVTDPKLNAVNAEYDFRVLRPHRITDPNGNQSEVLFDTLGMVAATALSGKTPSVGDSLTGLVADLDDATIAAYLSDPRGQALALLGDATTRFVYDLKSFTLRAAPLVASAIARETHVSDLASGTTTRVQLVFVYSDGFAREVLKKAQAEPADRTNPVPRWIGSGWTEFDNKGNPVRQYEPYFSDTPAFEINPTGVTRTMLYDPLGRKVATHYPNHTYDKVVFNPWEQATWDPNDTVLLQPGADLDVGALLSRLPASDLAPTWRDARFLGQIGAAEQTAAVQAALHKETPKIALLDPLERVFSTTLDNGVDASGARDLQTTTLELDIEGNTTRVTDPRLVPALLSTFDMAKRCVYEKSADAGEHWKLPDIAGKPIRTWDGVDGALLTHAVVRLYDELRRPTDVLVQTGTQAQIVAERSTYRDGNDPTIAAVNGLGRPYQSFDGAGRVTATAYDFKGNLAGVERQVTARYDVAPNWGAAPVLDPEIFASTTDCDALNRAVHVVNHHDGTDLRRRYNEAGLFDGVDVIIRGQGSAVPYVKTVDYDAKGQRLRCEHGNEIVTTYHYEPDTFRLSTLTTTRGGLALQALTYTYDPVGNVTHVEDAGQPDVFYNDSLITASGDYTYDPVYRLTIASGREHIGLAGEPRYDTTDGSRRGMPLPGDKQALRNYTDLYQYDPSGNLTFVQHRLGRDPSGPTIWNRHHRNDTLSNQLISTEFAGDDPNLPLPKRYDYDAHGNTVAMPHLTLLEWDYAGRLVKTVGGGVASYYAYDASGTRVRKSVEKNGATLVEKRTYLAGYEVFRSGDGASTTLERQSVHVMDGERRFALVETQTMDAGAKITGVPAIRYQFGNHLGSAMLELDDAGKTIRYEEYHPYGTTAYQSGLSAAETSLKRYRYTGKERDEDTGFNYHGARYYAPWLMRWTSPDPKGMVDGPNVYAATRNNPVLFTDGDGMEASSAGEPTQPQEGVLGKVSRLAHVVAAPLHAVLHNIEHAKTLETIEELTTSADARVKLARQTFARFHEYAEDGLGLFSNALRNTATELREATAAASRLGLRAVIARGAIKATQKTLTALHGIAIVAAGIEQYKSSSAQTQVGKVVDAVAGAVVTKVFAEKAPVTAAIESIVSLVGGEKAEGYTPGKLLSGSVHGIVILGEAAVTREGGGLDAFVEHTSKGEYGKPLQAANAIGEPVGDAAFVTVQFAKKEIASAGSFARREAAAANRYARGEASAAASSVRSTLNDLVGAVHSIETLKYFH